MTTKDTADVWDRNYALAPNALVIAEDERHRKDAADAAEMAGVRVRARMDPAAALDALAKGDAADLILVDAIGAPPELIDALLGRTQAACARGARLVMTLGADQIDAIVPELLASGCTLLCQPTMHERIAAIGLAAAKRGAGRFQDATAEAETARLRRLNEEVARIADALARLTRGEDPPRDPHMVSVRDPGQPFRPDDGAAPPITATEIRGAIRARRLRGQYFDAALFADPAWDMLLDLFASELEHRQVSVSSLCIAAAVPPTTALRWIGTMHDVGLFERNADPSDRRRAYIGLSAKGRAGMRAYVGAAKRAGLGIA